MTADAFSDPAAVASYAERARRSVSGLGVLHRIVQEILAESVYYSALTLRGWLAYARRPPR
ncbi:hypothetical protein [Gaiella sp.]|uniref:hypothetical protein n=1 Tax=Gaiella sp. TaxID=2663207 RepID=UPI002E2EDFEB|nr:hypothetical protein [Gaiella sp.]HEX5582130.1 hypothetical protein [Gaiella sp.]